jgi:hypothetical protein
MQRMIFNFALAVLSLVVSYAIVAKWPDADGSAVARITTAPPVVGATEMATPITTDIGLAK